MVLSLLPALRKAFQCAGRHVREPGKVGMVFFMDSRFAEQKIIDSDALLVEGGPPQGGVRARVDILAHSRLLLEARASLNCAPLRKAILAAARWSLVAPTAPRLPADVPDSSTISTDADDGSVCAQGAGQPQARSSARRPRSSPRASNAAPPSTSLTTESTDSSTELEVRGAELSSTVEHRDAHLRARVDSNQKSSPRLVEEPREKLTLHYHGVLVSGPLSRRRLPRTQGFSVLLVTTKSFAGSTACPGERLENLRCVLLRRETMS